MMIDLVEDSDILGAFTGLLNILLAFAYDTRITEGENNVDLYFYRWFLLGIFQFYLQLFLITL